MATSTEAIPLARGPSLVRRLRAIPWGAPGAMVLALAGAVLTLRLWHGDLTIPFRYAIADDTKFYLSLAKGIIDHGWFLTNPSLGTPFGQELYDFPQSADNLNLLLIKGLGFLWPHAGTVVNLFYLLTFPLNALAAYLVMRRFGISRGSAMTCATAFALLAYHFFRSDSQLLLSAYYSIPLGCYLFLCVTSGESLFERRTSHAGRWRAWLSRRTIWTVLICVVIASSGLYYAVFAFLLVLAGALFAMLSHRGRSAIAAGFIVSALIAAGLALSLSPTIAYQLRHGANPAVTRNAGVGDNLSLSISYLVLPSLRDRIAPLRHLATRYALATPPHGYCEQCYESLGTVGTIGFGWLVLVGLAGCLGAPWATLRAPLHRAAAAGVAICLALGVTGGISSLTRVFLSADIRAWNRLSLEIAFFSLLAAGLLLDRVRSRLASRPHAGLTFAVLLAAVIGLTVYEQSSSYFTPNFTRDAFNYHSDGRFFASIEHQLPAEAMVFNLPYVPFPEGYQPYSAPDQTIPYNHWFNYEYDEIRGYLHSTQLRWSYGAMKGRSADWEAQLAAKPVDLAIAGAAAAGFKGMVIDAHGYPGRVGVNLGRELRQTLGVSPIRSPAQDLSFYDLRPLRRLLSATYSPSRLAALRAAVLNPLALSCTTGTLTVINPYRAPHTATLVSTLTGARRLRLRVTASGRSETLIVGADRNGMIHHQLLLSAGQTSLRLLPAPGEGAGAQMHAPALLDSAFTPFVRASGPAITTGILGPPCAMVGVGQAR